jgi:16S rRNA (cytosine967-C5)-methyltransferase
MDRVRQTLRDPRDRALLLEITAGTLRWQAALDALLAHCSTRPIGSLTSTVRAILRISAYQLEHLTRVPVHAVLNEAVELTRRVGEPRASGFVNAVLRKWTRTRNRWTLPGRPARGAPLEDRVAYLSITLSHPAWLVRRWIERVGFDHAEAWCRFNNEPPTITLRPVRSKSREASLELIRAAGVEADPARFVDDAITLQPGTSSALPPDIAREFIAQDEASQLVAHAAGAREGERVLDLCASPGGKTLVLASDQRRGLLVACDYRARRVRLLHRTVRESDAHAHVVALDATRPLPFQPVFDCVLADVPCSGLGIIRRDPDLKWSRQPDDLAAFAGVQLRILTQASSAVAKGGRLVYATCSSEPEENEAVVDAFIARDHDFTLMPIAGPTLSAAPSLLCARGFLRTVPFVHALDGFFAAMLVRRP